MGEIQVIKRGGYRSLFWPMVLIGIGVIWLLGNLGILSAQNLVVAARLWPILLIVVGLDLLFGRQSPQLGAVIGIGTVVLLIILMLIGPSIGLGYNFEVSEVSGSEPVEDATSATVVLEVGTGELTVNPLTDSKTLMEHDVRAIGEVLYTVEGQANKTLTLRQDDDGSDEFYAFLFDLFENDENNLRWNIGLNPDVPVALRVSNGTGGATLDLADMNLTELSVNLGTGSMDLALPVMDSNYDATLTAGTGGGKVTLPEGITVNLRINVGTGSFTIDIPEGAAVRLEGSTGTGSINVPSDFRKVTGDDGNVVGEKGTWETDGYSDSNRKITLRFEGGTGGLTVQ